MIRTFQATLLLLLAAACAPAQERAAEHLSVMDDAGRAVTLTAPASRVFSLLPSITESVVALGAREVLVARTDYDRAATIASLPSLGGTLRPNLEALAALRPDLVITWASSGQDGTTSRMTALGVPVYRAEVQTLDDLWRHLSNLGVLLDRTERAAVVADSLQRSLAVVSEAVAGRARPSVYYSLWHDPPQTAGTGTYIDEIVRLAGGRNVFDDAAAAWPQVSLEEIVRRDPDALVVALPSGASAEHAAWLRAPGWRELSAAKADRVLLVDSDVFNRPGPHVGEVARELAAFLHPDVMVPDSP